MNRRWFVVIVFSLFSLWLYAQKTPSVKSYEVSLNFGVFVLASDSLTPSESVDFLNYIEKTDLNYIPEPYVGLASRVVFNDNFQTSLHMILWSDFSIQDFNLSASYQWTTLLGINAGVYTNSNYMSYFSSYHVLFYPRFSDLNTNLRQRKIKERGFVLGPRFSYIGMRFRTELLLNVGFGYNKPFSEKLVFGEKGGNQKNMLVYDTNKEWHISLAPKWSFSYDLHQGNVATVGVNGSIRYYYAQQTIGYKQTFVEWTRENSYVISPAMPSHKVSRLYPEVGIYWRW